MIKNDHNPHKQKSKRVMCKLKFSSAKIYRDYLQKQLKSKMGHTV